MDTADTVIIGAGVIGLAVADRLAGAGRRVVLLDRGTCGAEASWAGAGILSPCSWHRRDDLARIHMDAIFSYQDFAADLQERSGVDPQYRRCGAFKLIRDDNRMKMARREVEVVGTRTTPDGEPIVRTLSPDQARELEPRFAAEVLGVQHCRMTAQIRNPRLLRALRIAAQRRGVHILENTPVRSLLGSTARVSGVRTTSGTIAADVTIVCAGAWSAELDARIAELAPVYPVRGQIVLLRAKPAPIERILEEGNFYMVARDDHHVLVGATEEHDSGFCRRTTAGGIAGLTQQALDFVPALEAAEVVRTWAGLRPGTPDRRPVLGPAAGIDGLLLCSGHFRTGLTTAPVVAAIVADLLDHGTCDYDLEKCVPGRFGP